MILAWAGVCLVISLATGYFSVKNPPPTEKYIAKLICYVCFILFIILMITYVVHLTPSTPHEPMLAATKHEAKMGIKS